MQKAIISILLFTLLYSCGFDKEKWHTEEWNREKLISGLFHDFLIENLPRDTIVETLGDPILIKCDSNYWNYGTVRYWEFDEIESSLIVKNDFIFNLIVNKHCEDAIKIDRYEIGSNGSGPNLIALMYKKEHYDSIFRLKTVFFEYTN